MDIDQLMTFFDKAPPREVLEAMEDYLQSEYRADLSYFFEETNITEDLLHEHISDEMDSREIVDLYMRQLSDRRRRFASTI